ncbi:MAG TPA: cell division protein FtsH, partial [Bryobacteraceae bacterium]|nr:cell division protein FtsH [Bryobacteraceae bacterium]
ADPVRRVSIIPRSIGALGHTLQLPGKDRYLMTELELEDRISVMLGGRAAEDIVYQGVTSTGASDDLQRATELARQMVTRYGMSKHLGAATYGLPRDPRFLRTPFGSEERNYSEHTAEQIDAEIREIMDRLYEHVKSILTERHATLTLVTRELIRKETLERDELEKLLASAPAPEPALRQ